MPQWIRCMHIRHVTRAQSSPAFVRVVLVGYVESKVLHCLLSLLAVVYRYAKERLWVDKQTHSTFLKELTVLRIRGRSKNPKIVVPRTRNPPATNSLTPCGLKHNKARTCANDQSVNREHVFRDRH